MSINRNISGAGFSFALDKIVSALSLCRVDDSPTIDVVICITGARPNLREVAQILRSLWMAGIQCAVVESKYAEEGQDLAGSLGAIYYIIYDDDATLRLRSWINDKFEERLLNRDEMIAYIKKMMRSDNSNEATIVSSSSSSSIFSSANFQQNSTNFTDSSKYNKSTTLAGPTLPSVDINFMSMEKMTASTRRRYENVLTQHMSSTLLLFNKKEEITVVAVDLSPCVLRALISAIEPGCSNLKEISNEISLIIERFPDNKRYIKDVVKEVVDIYSEKKKTSIICLYCLKDSYYRFIL